MRIPMKTPLMPARSRGPPGSPVHPSTLPGSLGPEFLRGWLAEMYGFRYNLARPQYCSQLRPRAATQPVGVRPAHRLGVR